MSGETNDAATPPPSYGTIASPQSPVDSPGHPAPSGVRADDSAADYRPDNPPAYVAQADAPPPSYESIFGKVKKINQESENSAVCLKKTCAVLCNSVGCLLLVALFLGVPISMIVMGSLYLDSCPYQRMVPIYLVVAGATGTAYWLITLLRQIVKKCSQSGDGEDDSPPHPIWKAFDSLLNTFTFAWFIVGNWAIYSTWGSRPCPEGIYTCPDTFCDPIILLFGFWLLNASYILCGCCCCGGIGLACICAKIAKDD